VHTGQCKALGLNLSIAKKKKRRIRRTGREIVGSLMEEFTG
jgi:hypothetical protein